MNKLYIVDDHPIMREMLQHFLEMSPDLSVAGYAESAEETLKEIPEIDVDLILIDVSLPEMSGIGLAKEIRRRWPELLCLMFSAHEEASYARRSLAAGARGYVVKGDPEDLVVAVRTILKGEIYISTPLRGKLSDQVEARE